MTPEDSMLVMQLLCAQRELADHLQLRREIDDALDRVAAGSVPGSILPGLLREALRRFDERGA
jgi:hypothetical protein